MDDDSVLLAQLIEQVLVVQMFVWKREEVKETDVGDKVVQLFTQTKAC
jgi:hypothetical protein